MHGLCMGKVPAVSMIVLCCSECEVCNWKTQERPINPLTPELNPSAQRCLTRFFYWGFCLLNLAFR
jgi:hypothetical protein